MNKQALVVGFGMIGRPLCQALLQNGWEVAYVLTSRGIFRLHAGELEGWVGELQEYERILSEVSVVCLALSAADNGVLEYGYMLPALKQGKIVITCAKRALANYLDLYPYATAERPILGLDATVGGNSGILQHLRNRINPKLAVEMHFVINASMNCFMFELAEGGNSPSAAMEEVRRRGLAEPIKQKGKFAPFFAGEVNDTMFKTSILINYCRLLSVPRMMMQDWVVRHLGEEALQRLFRSRDRRYIVSIFSGDAPDEDVIGGFTHTIVAEGNKLSISAGFKLVSQEPYARMKIPGALNAAFTIEGPGGAHGTSYIEGVGAGPGPTVAALIQNLNRLAGTM